MRNGQGYSHLVHELKNVVCQKILVIQEKRTRSFVAYCSHRHRRRCHTNLMFGDPYFVTMVTIKMATTYLHDAFYYLFTYLLRLSER